MTDKLAVVTGTSSGIGAVEASYTKSATAGAVTSILCIASIMSSSNTWKYCPRIADWTVTGIPLPQVYREVEELIRSSEWK